MNFLRVAFQPALWVGCLFSVGMMGCSGDRACAIDGDCFQGELCISGICDVAGSGATNNGSSATNNATQPAQNNSTSTNNDTSNGTTGPTNNGTTATTNNSTGTTNGGTSGCLVNLFGNVCDEDEFEENDGYDPATPNWDTTPWESNSWCDGADILEPSRTLSGTLCAGDRGDAFRFVVANNGPMCITSDFVTFRILVQFAASCDGTLLRVEPYTFGRDPIRNDLCADDPNVRCTVSNGGRTHLIEWVWEGQQIFDPRVQIMSGAQNVQLDYDVTFEILPQ